ncbi:MAG: DUF302 domain-containing protein [Bacteroidetes bacterium]|jgi:uncharacterized protein (DUF302 family)|nr:DUF302 domain-containing protein [Bacteroidota bacterium]MBT3748436.1 DUF302 domain-containing protein [Bacteroidota bacterium]MBT4402113.1 DUF302 domain-containing protein [Bacteroidota bacterium]MBT4409123.1 DUF302 domain-containing protein [Bacteroidota bacterium]MBT7462661.1 DUF302 domain-containing protein [Bacteroidota bacterium]
MVHNQLMLENESKESFFDSINWIEKTMTDNDWKILDIHDLQNSMENNGYEVLPVKVFAVCQPHHAIKVLGKDDDRIVSAMMPCRISVYTKSDGKTYISRINTGMMADDFHGAMKELMVSTSEEIEEMLEPILLAL